MEGDSLVHRQFALFATKSSHWPGEYSLLLPFVWAWSHRIRKLMPPKLGLELGTDMKPMGKPIVLPPSPQILQTENDGASLTDGTKLGDELGFRLSDGVTLGRFEG